MRKICFAALFAACLLVASFALAEEVKPDLVIKEKMFLTQMSDIQLNYTDYLGKVLRFEGLLGVNEYEGATYRMVYRRAPGCCGADGIEGLEVSGDVEWPEAESWVEVTGRLVTYMEGEYMYLTVEVSDIRLPEKRGKEFVTQ